MTVATINFPTTLDTADTLIRVVNKASSTIGTGGVNTSVTTIPVASAASAPASGIAWCGNEAILYESKDATNLLTCTRHFDGTATESHAVGDPIYFSPIIAAHHRVHSDAIIAIETLLGAAGVNVKPGGSSTQVQFNNSGAFGGDAGLTYNAATDALTIGGALNVGGLIDCPDTLGAKIALYSTNYGIGTESSQQLYFVDAPSKHSFRTGSTYPGVEVVTINSAGLAITHDNTSTANELTLYSRNPTGAFYNLVHFSRWGTVGAGGTPDNETISQLRWEGLNSGGTYAMFGTFDMNIGVNSATGAGGAYQFNLYTAAGVNQTMLAMDTRVSPPITTANVSLQDIDFVAKGDLDAYLLYVDASTDRVGIGTNTPQVKFDVNGTIGTPLVDFPSSTGHKLDLYDTSYAIGVESGELRISAGTATTDRVTFVHSYGTTPFLAASETALTASAPVTLSNLAGTGTRLVTASSVGLLASVAFDADLSTLSVPANTTISAFGNTLVDDADAATARTTLGLVSAGTGDIWLRRGGDTATGPIGVPDDPYASGWNGSVNVPTKNAVWDKIEALVVFDAGTLTIASGVVTLPTIPGGTNVINLTIDTEAAAATDDLDNVAITGTVPTGTLLVVRLSFPGRNPTIKKNSNMGIVSDFTLSASNDRMLLVRHSLSVWAEVARSPQNQLVVNPALLDVDTVMKGDLDANLFYLDASTDSIGIGTATPSSWLDLKAGTANRASLLFPNSAFLTTPLQGAVEAQTSGTNPGLYMTLNAAVGRAQLEQRTFWNTNTSGAAIGPTAADFFGANSAFGLSGNYFHLEAWLYFTKTTAGTVQVQVVNSATFNNFAGQVEMDTAGGGTAAGTGTTANIINASAATQTFAASPSLTTATTHLFILRCQFRNGSGTNIRIQVISSAGTVTPLGMSFQKLTLVHPNSTGAFVA